MSVRRLLNVVYVMVAENMEEDDRNEFDHYLHATVDDMKEDRLANIYAFGGEVVSYGN